MRVDSQTSLYESRVFTVIDRKKRMEQFEEVSQAVEPEKPSSKELAVYFRGSHIDFWPHLYLPTDERHIEWRSPARRHREPSGGSQ